MAVFRQKMLKTVVLAKMALFWQKMLKTVVLAKMAFFGKSSLRQWFCPKLLKSGKRCSKLCNLAKLALVWRKPAQNRLFRQKWLNFRKSCSNWQNDQNGIILAKSTRNCVFWPKWLYFGHLQEKINHNQNFSAFSETEAINLKKVASFFQDTIHFHPGHLQPKTLIFTIRALVE